MTELRTMYPHSPNEDPNNQVIQLPSGFSWQNFVESVLIPEVIGVLISEDMGVDLEEAFVIWEKSTRFGIAAFPEEG